MSSISNMTNATNRKQQPKETAVAVQHESSGDAATKELLKEMQRVCADELARCVRRLEEQLTEKHLLWQQEVDKSIARLSREVTLMRDETQEILEAAHEDQENVFQVLHDRLTVAEEELAQMQYRSTSALPSKSPLDEGKEEEERHGGPQSTTSSRSGSDEVKTRNNYDSSAKAATEATHTAPMEVLSHIASMQPLASGEKMDVTGFRAMNAASYVLQYARIHRGQQGIVDSVSGEMVSYGQLPDLVQRVGTGLRALGFRDGDTLKICTDASSVRLLVLTLSAWSLSGTVEVESSMYDDGTQQDAVKVVVEDGKGGNAGSGVNQWVVCDSQKYAHTQVSRIALKLARAIVVHPLELGSIATTKFIQFDDLQATELGSAMQHKQVSPTAIALRIVDCDCVTSFTHFQVIESVERSLQAFSHEFTCEPDAFILNALPFNHSASLPLGFLPAIALGVSVLPVRLFATKTCDQDILNHFAHYEISTIIMSPECLVLFSECRTLRNLQTPVLQTILCAGVPIPTLPRALKCFSVWKSELRCRRMLSSSRFLGGVFATDDLLAPIRQKTGPSLNQELGVPLANIDCNVKKPVDGNGDDSPDVYELTVGMPFGLLPEGLIATGVFVTVSWETEGDTTVDGSRPKLHVVAIKRASGDRAVSLIMGGDAKKNARHILYPVLPIEELIASHPLILDLAIQESRDLLVPLEAKDTTKEAAGLTVLISLTMGARKYHEDSLATIKNFIAKKISKEENVKFDKFLLVGRIFRDEYGRAIKESLVHRALVKDDDKGGGY
uniref:AMP-dependent synthetase/ligase domain-containing protein n=1 Tax=Globisporangium ultimum (strain ATCC 200006 / CBS 805.95 / DAOM BR144) TaxID=431595 RepID=K3WC29_GLOUD